jgi:hypothetical protein
VVPLKEEGLAVYRVEKKAPNFIEEYGPCPPGVRPPEEAEQMP